MNFSILANLLYPMLPELLVFVGAIACLLTDLFVKHDSYRISSYVALLTVVLALYSLFLFDSYDKSVLDGLFILSLENFPYKFLILICTFIILAISDFHLVAKGASYGEFHFITLISTLSFMLVVSSDNFVLIFFALETASLSTYILCGLRRTRVESSESAMKYFVVGSVAAVILLYGATLMFGASGSMKLQTIFSAAHASPDKSLFMLGYLLVASALCIKLAAAPFHWWSPDVYKGAPSPVVAYLSTVSKIASFWLLAKFVIGLGELYPKVNILLQSLAMFSILFGAIAAYRYQNIKSILAMSSVSNIGFLILMLMLHKGRAMLDIYFYFGAYSLATIGTLGILSVLERNVDRPGGLTLKDLGGLGFSQSKISVILSIFMLSYAGIPLTAGFIGKFRIFSSVISSGALPAIIITVLGSVISLYYYFKIVLVMYQRTEHEPSAPCFKDVSGPFLNVSYLGIALSVILTIILGIKPDFMLVLGSFTNY